MSDAVARDVARRLYEMQGREAGRLKRITQYLRDDERALLPGLPEGVPPEVGRIARFSRVNVVRYVVNARVQNLYVDGYRAPRKAVNLPVWGVLRRNRFNLRQIGIHRSALSYGASYVVSLPGRPVPVIRGVSPLDMTAAYGEDDFWPEFALERRRDGSFRLYDNRYVYRVVRDPDRFDFQVAGVPQEHGATFYGERVCPVVRYRETDDLDKPVSGLVEPLMALQDQINVTTFGLLVAQHYGAFRQRAIIGWLADTEEKRLMASAASIWTFDEDPSQIALHEFEATDLSGYLESREASLRHMATLSQTPVHELTAQLVNLNAEALAAAEKSHRRAIVENQTALGESHEQLAGVTAEYMGETPDPNASVRWRDTEARALAAVVDAWGKAAQMLGIPPRALWERIPGVTDDDIERWERLAREGDPLGQLETELARRVAEMSGSGANVEAASGGSDV